MNNQTEKTMKIPERLDNKQLIEIIKKQIRLCLIHKHFHSIIFISLRTKRNIVFEYLDFFCNANWFIKKNIIRVRNNSNEVIVCFKNGSFIRVMPGSHNARGYRATNVIIDSDITNQEIIHCIIRPIIMPLIIKNPKWMTKLFGIKPYHRKRFRKTEYRVKI